MQRIKTSKWSTRNPFGDRLFYKPRFVYGTTMTIPTTAPFVKTTFTMNSMATISTQAGDAPGMLSLGQAFNQYRIRGLKIKITYWPDPAQAGVPIVGYFNAGPNAPSLVSAPAINTLPEQRWAKYKTLNQPGTGSKPTTLSVYYSVNKIWGPDQVVKNDVAFTAAVGSGGLTSWSSPVNAALAEFGLLTMSGLNPTAALNVVCKVEMTPYIELFSKKLITS